MVQAQQTTISVDTSELTPGQVELARAIGSLLEGFDYADVLPCLLVISGSCIRHLSDDADDAISLAEAMGAALIAVVEREQP